jgi:hypothetical protein
MLLVALYMSTTAEKFTPSGVSGPTQPAAYSPQHSNISTGTVPSSVNSALIGGLIGGIVGTLLVGGGIVVLVILLRRKRKQKKSTQIANKDDKTKPVTSDENGAMLESRRQTVMLENETNSKEMSHSEVIYNKETITQSANSLLKRSQVITFTELKVEKKIGTGSYGKVCLGQWNAAPVALKFCRKKGNLEDFMREIRLMM